MAESRSHKATARRIADKYGTQYKPGKGPDIVTASVIVEVETPQTIAEAPRQLQGYRKPVYVAGTNQEAVRLGLKKTKGTTIGVMDNQGKIIKGSTRKKQ